MFPAFFSRSHALSFLALLLGALLLPLLAATLGFEPSRRELYQTIPVERGPFSYIHHQIFEEKGDIDILFLGDSLMWDAFDPQIFIQAMREKVGREPVVRVLGFNWRQEDIIYVLLRDVLSNRRVKLLVLNMPTPVHVLTGIHYTAYRWLRYSDIADLASGLPSQYLLQFYGAAVLGAPRQLLSQLRPNRVEKEIPFASHFGQRRIEAGYLGRTYVDRHLSAPHYPNTAFTYSPETKQNFSFDGSPVNRYQLHFMKKTFALAKEARVSTLIVHIPRAAERNEKLVKERMPWQTVLGKEFPVVGLPPATFFAGLSDEEILSLYYDDHFNISGGKFFTQTMLAPIMDYYEKSGKNDAYQAANGSL